MEYIHFTWSSSKDSQNLAKHGVSFEEARTAFFDEKARLMNDPEHSDQEDRFLLLGMSRKLRLLLVCHCYRGVRRRFELFRLGKPQLLSLNSIGGLDMRKEYDFSHSVRNPYIRKLKKAISIRIDPDTIGYFKKIAEETGIPYQNLMNHYLADCASKGLRPSMTWKKQEVGARK